MTPERKSVVAEFKTRKTPGEFEALFSVFGNIDRDSDRIHKGAFAPAFEAESNPAVVWTHRWDIPPIGETLEAVETDNGAKGVARLFLKEHEIAQQVWAGLESKALKQFSFAFDIGEHSFTEPGEGEKSNRYDGKIREITKISEVFEWGPTLIGANPLTAMLSAKSLANLLGVPEDFVANLGTKDGDPGDETDLPEDDPADDDPEDEKEAPDAAEVARLLAEQPMIHVHS